MIKKLTKHGNSMALILDKALLEIYKISENTSLELTTDGKALNISPVVETSNDESFENALKKINKKYGTALKKMA